MHLLDGRFRRQFVPDGDGYRFRQWGQDVHFTRDEFETLVANRRRLWSSPLVWGIYLTAGVALPIWLAATGWDGAAWALAVIALIFMAVILVSVDRRPHEIAQTRVSVSGGGPGPVSRLAESPYLRIPYYGLLIYIAASNAIDPKVSLWWRVPAALLAFWFVSTIVADTRTWWRARHG